MLNMKEQNPTSFLTPTKSQLEPLDLLIDLVRKRERDILQIDIHSITCRYISSLQKKEGADLEDAGDFIRMASWLLYIKSKELLPKKELEEGPELSELKNKLSRRMALCQKFQKVGMLLYSRVILGRDCWKSPRSLKSKLERETKIEVDKEMALSWLTQAYHQKLMDKKSRENYKIPKAFPSLLSHIKRIGAELIVGVRLPLSQLIRQREEKQSRLLSFLSILELSKSGFVSLFQKKPFSKIEILVKKTITKMGIKNLSIETAKENYENF